MTPHRRTRSRWEMMRRVLLIAVAGIGLLAVVLIVEVLLARRTEQLDGWERAQLEGTFGSGGDPVHLVWIGDSTGDGVGATAPVHALPRVVAEGLSRSVRLSVLARSGSRTADAVAEQLPELEGLRPDWVIVGIGNNDVIHLTSRARFESSLNRLLTGVMAVRPRRVAVLGIAEFAGTPLFAQPLRMIAGWRADQFDAAVRRVAERHGALYVDIIGETGDAFVGDPARFHARDRFHPSDAGYRLWADATLEAIARAGWGARW